jgi:dolichol kinase
MWGALAFGDGLATLVGSQMGKGPLPWNRKKTVSGCVAYVCGATPAMAFLYVWTIPNLAESPRMWSAEATQSLLASPGIAEVIAISFLTAAASALLESLETPIDDNLLAPLGGAVIMTALAYLLF